MSISGEYARPLYVPVRQYMEFLMQQGLIDKQLGSFYLEGYETARFSNEPLSQDQYMDIMKHLAAILKHMGYNLKSSSHHQTPPVLAASESVTSLGHRSHHDSAVRPSSSSRNIKHRFSSISHPIDQDTLSTHTWNSHSSS